MWHRILGLTLLVTSLAIGWVWTQYRQFRETPLPLPADGLIYTLSGGGSAASVARDLQRLGLLQHTLYFRLLARQEQRAHRLQAGEYRIPAGTTPTQLLALLSSGRVVQYPLTLVEGWSFERVLQALRRADTLVHTLDGLAPSEIMRRLDRAGTHPEGLFLPDTYLFPRATPDIQALARAMAAMDRLLEEEWASRDPGLPLSEPYQALILASIVEKETGLAQERPRIAGVLVRRLRKGMKLQTDPTVIYGLGDAFDGNLRRADLTRDTPYNTYVRTGLPPTPIAMPGRDALHAVLHPTDSDSLYFVARGDGSHHFSATLREHNQAVRRYQLKR
jgi:UPF0755 protein